MAVSDIFSQDLIIESDIQDFMRHVLETAAALGLRTIGLMPALNRLLGPLREDGAGLGQPLQATVQIKEGTLLVRWGTPSRTFPLTTLPAPPDPVVLESLIARLRMATQVNEPSRLLTRNLEIMRRFEETRRTLRSEILSMQAALDKRQAELHESIRLAETDALTGLLNRRAFDRQLEQAYRRVLRQQNEQISLLVLDLDGFKQLNDTHGHPHGDGVLREMAKTLESVIRTGVDSAYRIGGDEFAILMWSDGDTACRKAMQILERMDGQISIGAASLSGGTEIETSPSRFFELADSALYRSKEAGRGCVTADTCLRRGTSGCRAHCSDAAIPAPASA